MTKYALLIGCNYLNSPDNRLNGCIYDVEKMKVVLLSVFGYKEENIFFLSDDNSNTNFHPTYSNIITYLEKLVNLSSNAEELFLHYSGHGTQVRDKNRDEPDRNDEGIVPVDFSQSGILIDDVLFDKFFSKVNSNCRTVCVFDSCNSGSISDLDCSWLSDGKKCYKSILSNKQPLNKKIFVLSGCVDNNYSYESIDPETKHPCGALSLSLRNLLQENNWILPIDTLIINLTKKLKTASFAQTPVLSTGFDSNLTELVFVNPKP